MAAESGAEARRGSGCGVGTQLRAARERAGLTIAQAAGQLRLEGAVLEALEAERFETLGAPIYVKGYLSRYAQLLGEPVGALQEQFTAQGKMSEPDLTHIVRLEVPRSGISPVTLKRALIVLAVLGIAVLIGWAWSRRHLATPVPIPASPPMRGSPAMARSVRPHAISTAPPAGGKTATAPAPAPGGGATAITVSFPAASWVAVQDAAGHWLYRGMVVAGARRTFSGPAPLHVVLGYADRVAVKVDGRAVPIGAYVGANHAAAFEVAADGRLMPETGG